MRKTKSEILAIIPARGGSKGIPRKNIKDFGGLPLVAHIIKAVKSVSLVTRIIVSTDDLEIKNVAEKFGAEVPFLRPAALSGDAVPTLPVLNHTLKYLKSRENYHPDYVLLVYPTSPLLKSKRIQDAINLILNNKSCDSVVSGTFDKGHYWINSKKKWQRLFPKTVANRQKAKPLFKENGAIYLNKTNVLKKSVVGENILPLIMDQEENIDIDEMVDFERALKKYRNQ